MRHPWFSVVIFVASALSTASAQTPAPFPALFTQAQAARGRDVYAAECSACHGGRLNDGSATALVGVSFLQK